MGPNSIQYYTMSYETLKKLHSDIRTKLSFKQEQLTYFLVVECLPQKLKSTFAPNSLHSIFFSKTGRIHHFKKIVNSPLVELFYSSERWQNDIQNLTLLIRKFNSSTPPTQFRSLSNEQKNRPNRTKMDIFPPGLAHCVLRQDFNFTVMTYCDILLIFHLCCFKVKKLL